MENERAIQALNELREDCYEDDGYGNMTDECAEKLWAIDAAIEALKERKTGKWNVITKRPMDAEEREIWEVEMGEIADEDAYMYENLPEEGEEVLVCTHSGRVFIDTMCKDEGCYFEDYGEMDGIVAWMPLPEPYYGLGQTFDPD